MRIGVQSCFDILVPQSFRKGAKAKQSCDTEKFVVSCGRHVAGHAALVLM